MRRGNALRESPADHTADWEPLVLASVGPCSGGREGWSHAELTQNHTVGQLQFSFVTESGWV